MSNFDFKTYWQIVRGENIEGDNLLKFARAARAHCVNYESSARTIENLRSDLAARDAEIALLKTLLGDNNA